VKALGLEENEKSLKLAETLANIKNDDVFRLVAKQTLRLLDTENIDSVLRKAKASIKEYEGVQRITAQVEIMRYGQIKSREERWMM
jgi:hypothetical protein